MVRSVRQGRSYREAARRFRVSVATVALWVRRAAGRSLREVDWRDRPSGGLRGQTRTCARIVRTIGRIRRQLQRHDALGEHGPAAIRRHLLANGESAPCERTIARWLVRLGLSGRERWRRPPPPKGWYLPEVCAGGVEMDSGDIVEGLRLRGGRRIEAFNVLAVSAGTVDTIVAESIHTPEVIGALTQRWRREGCPRFLQCDNDTVFTGAHAQRPYLGRLVHWCLCVGVVPVFTPPGELGFQASIEAYNRRWQERVWQRWRHPSLAALQQRSAAFVHAYGQRAQLTREAPPRQPWIAPAAQPRVHRIVLLRRLDASGHLLLCARQIAVTARWANRLVRCELDVANHRLQIYGLRRRDPHHQPRLITRTFPVPLVSWQKSTDR
jgi:hypothetical protein